MTIRPLPDEPLLFESPPLSPNIILVEADVHEERSELPYDVNSLDNLNLIFAKGNQVKDKEQVEEVNNENNFLHTEEEIENLDEAFEEELQDSVDDSTLIETTGKTKRKKRFFFSFFMGK